MKRMFILLLAVLLICPCLALGETLDLSQMSDSDLRQLRDQINVELSQRVGSAPDALAAVTIDGCLIEVLAVERTVNYANAPSLLFTYRFTNNSAAATTMLRIASIKMFQNGVQLDSASSIQGVNLNEISKEVKPGGSLVCYGSIKLQDEENAVDLEIKRQFGVSTEAETLILTYTLDN